MTEALIQHALIPPGLCVSIFWLLDTPRITHCRLICSLYIFLGGTCLHILSWSINNLNPLSLTLAPKFYLIEQLNRPEMEHSGYIYILTGGKYDGYIRSELIFLMFGWWGRKKKCIHWIGTYHMGYQVPRRDEWWDCLGSGVWWKKQQRSRVWNSGYCLSAFIYLNESHLQRGYFRCRLVLYSFKAFVGT